MENPQSATALSLCRSGITSLLVGCLWGVMTPNTPYPRLALVAHVEFMSNGVMGLALGMLLWQKGLVNLSQSPIRLAVIKWGVLSAWIPSLMEVLNAWWGTADFLKIAAQQASAPGASPLKEQIMAVTHVFPGFALIASLSLLTWELFQPKLGKSL